MFRGISGGFTTATKRVIEVGYPNLKIVTTASTAKGFNALSTKIVFL
jgi:hypothetical protein